MSNRNLDLSVMQEIGVFGSPVAYNTAIPLSGQFVMAPQSISSATVFTPQANPQLGSTCYARLASNGTNVPVFSGMAEHGSSSGWSNQIGVVNLVTFWFDGVQVLYSIAQTIGGAVAAVVNTANVSYQTPTKINVVFTVSLVTGTVPAASAFTISNTGGADTVTNVSIVGGALVLTKSRSAQPGDVVTLSYTAPQANALMDNNGNQVASFVNRAVSYLAAPAALKVVRLTTLNHVVETGDSTAGYSYARAAEGGPSYTDAPRCVAWSSAALPANQDGFIQCKIDSVVDHNVILGFSDRSSPANGYQDMYIGIYQDASYTGYQPFFNYTNYGSSSAVAAPGDVIRIRRTGTNGYFEVSKDDGATFSTSATVSGITQAALYPMIQVAHATAKCVNLRGSNNIA